MSFLTMQDSLRAKLGNPSTAEVTQAKIKEWINSAYKDVAMKYRFKATRKRCFFNTVAAQAEYGLPADVFAMLSMYDQTNSQPLEKTGWKNFDEQGVIASAKPLYYATFGTMLMLSPTPDAVYTIRYRYKLQVAAMVADGDVIVIPDHWEDPIVLFARFWAWDELQQFEKAKYALNAFKIMIADIPDEMTEEASDFEGAVQVPHMAGGQSQLLDFDHSDEGE